MISITGTWIQEKLLAIGGPAGGVSSTSGDLARFWRALFSGRLLDPAMLRRLRAPVPAPPDAPGDPSPSDPGYPNDPEGPAYSGSPSYSWSPSYP